MRLDKILVVVALALVVGYLLVTRSASVSGSDARRLVEAGALLVDVRTPAEFGGGHIAGAINIPVQELEPRMSELRDKGRPIVLYCRSGSRSATAARVLSGAGYTDVHNLGAMSNW